MHFSPLYYCGSAQEKDEDPYIVNRCGIFFVINLSVVFFRIC